MIAGCLYATPADNVTASATPSLIVGAADSAYPLTNVDDLDPSVVFKTTGTTATIRFTFGVAQALDAIALFNHNLHGLTLTVTNNGGMASQNLVVPSQPEDNLRLDPWLDLREVASASATQWEIAIAGAAANIAIGEVALLEHLRELRIRWNFTIAERHPTLEQRTEYGKRLQYDFGVRVRRFEGLPFLYEDRADLRRLRRRARGSLIPWVLIPDGDLNDALLVQFSDEEHAERYEFHDGTDGVVDMPVAVEEVHAGLAL